jgi:hypothetical protein
MAARMKYPTAHHQLRELAEMALLEGTPFEVFWADAIRPGLPAITWATPLERRPGGCVVWPRDTFDRNCSIGATLDARDTWRRAYEGCAPTRSERALDQLRPVWEAMADVAERRAEVDRGLPSVVAVASAA